MIRVITRRPVEFTNQKFSNIVINFNNWNRQIQFYEPQVNIPSNVLEWRDISPRSLELGVAREVQ